MGVRITAYEARHGEVPKILEEALREYGEPLPHRGDYYGHGLVYEKTGKHSFLLHSSGRNDVYEYGGGDDLVVRYEEGKWSIGAAPAQPGMYPEAAPEANGRAAVPLSTEVESTGAVEAAQDRSEG